jgi:hydroxypyruvate isomerase
MVGDIIRLVQQNIQHIGHFHTTGDPGHNELDET